MPSQQKKADHDVELAQRPNSDRLDAVVRLAEVRRSSIAGLVVWGLLRMRLLRNLKAQNLMR